MYTMIYLNTYKYIYIYIYFIYLFIYIYIYIIPSGYGGSAPQTCNPDLFGWSGLRFHRVWVRMPAGQFRPSPNFLIQTFGSWLSCSRSVTYDDLASESAARSSTPMLWIFAAMVIYGDRIPLRFFRGSEATFSGNLAGVWIAS